MLKEDVFGKYPAVNCDWKLYKDPGDIKIRELWGTSLGNQMVSRCLHVGDVNHMVKSEIIKFNNIYEYYVRHLMVGNTFIVYPSTSNKGRDGIYKSYNIDPWNRQFPCFIDNEYSDYYKSLDDSSGFKIRYGYWVFYKDRVITNTDKYFNNKMLLYNVPPLMILTTTSLDGFTIACLDMVE